MREISSRNKARQLTGFVFPVRLTSSSADGRVPAGWLWNY